MRVLVYGGCGGLGRAVVQHFKSAGYNVTSVDIGENPEADSNVKVNLADDWVNQEKNVVQSVLDVLGGSKLEAVINVAGGWAGGNTQDPDWVKNADLMWKQSVWSSAIAATIASKCLKEGGLLVLPGAAPATSGTPGMMGYGMAKAAVHQLVKSLGGKGSGLPDGSCTLGILPVTLDTPMNRLVGKDQGFQMVGSCTLGILPVTLDTPMNRKFMPNADFSTWTPLSEVAGILEKWSKNLERPATGSLVSMHTQNNSTYLRLEH